jgi:hypothetical protein
MDGYTFSFSQRVVNSARLAIEVQVQTVLDVIDDTRKALAGGTGQADAFQASAPVLAVGLNGRTEAIIRALKYCQRSQSGRPA